MIVKVKEKHWWNKILDWIFDTKETYNFIAKDDCYKIKFQYDFKRQEYHGKLYINNRCKYTAGNTFYDYYQLKDVQSYKDVPDVILHSYTNKIKITQDKKYTIDEEINNMLKECERK